MRLSRLLTCVSLLFCLFLFTSCKTEPPAELQIYFTADVNGRLEPCGCFTGQYGGLTRIDTWLAHKDPSGESLRFDVGDAIKGTADYDIIHYEHLLEAFQDLNYAALNCGAREAALPAVELKKLAETEAPLVSANLVNKETGKLVFPAYRIIKHQNKKIAAIGLLDPESVAHSIGEGLEAQPMETVLTNWLPRLESEEAPDLIILLAFTDEIKMRALARQFYELDIILGGDVPQPAQKMITENESVIIYTTNQARAVGDLKLKLGKSGLTEPKYDVHLMVDTIPQSKAMLALSKSYRDLIRNTKLDIDDPATANNDSIIPGGELGFHYVGSEACASCHPSAMKVWKESRHSHAFATLTQGGTDADPNCIQCHTVGFGEISGYRREFDGKKLTQVGCESCHGPGSEHVKQRLLGDPAKLTFRFRPLGASDCTKCHHGEFSRPFNWDEFWPAIAHGSERKPIKK